MFAALKITPGWDDGYQVGDYFHVVGLKMWFQVQVRFPDLYIVYY